MHAFSKQFLTAIVLSYLHDSILDVGLGCTGVVCGDSNNLADQQFGGLGFACPTLTANHTHLWQ